MWQPKTNLYSNQLVQELPTWYRASLPCVDLWLPDWIWCQRNGNYKARLTGRLIMLNQHPKSCWIRPKSCQYHQRAINIYKHWMARIKSWTIRIKVKLYIKIWCSCIWYASQSSVAARIMLQSLDRIFLWHPKSWSIPLVLPQSPWRNPGGRKGIGIVSQVWQFVEMETPVASLSSLPFVH